MTTTYLLAIYEVDLAYGGPEEGGWYYNCGTLERVCKTFKNEAKAERCARNVNAWLTRLQKNQREVSSVLYSGGRYWAEIHENTAPAHYPETRPHYE